MRGYAPIVALITLLLIVLAIVGAKEAFTSTGTIVQLQTSHVPAAGEPDECKNGLYNCVYKWIRFGF
jgi:hypothetical protein